MTESTIPNYTPVEIADWLISHHKLLRLWVGTIGTQIAVSIFFGDAASAHANVDRLIAVRDEIEGRGRRDLLL